MCYPSYTIDVFFSSSISFLSCSNHLPPRVNTPDVQLELPLGNERPLRVIAERLRYVCPHSKKENRKLYCCCASRNLRYISIKPTR